ncbi:MAG: DNA gyrase subunit B [Gemmataceae bacterium]
MSDVVEEVVTETNGEYGEKNIKHLKDAAHIRHRPGMYIGNTSTAGLHHLVYELVYNSVDEALAGYCNNVAVKINADNSCTVDDDGRGIPVEEHAEHKLPTLQVVMTMLGTSGKFDNAAYKTSAGLHGMGSKAVTALSEWTEARVRRNGRTYMQQYERGKATTELKDIGASDHTGTSITFRPDPEIFRDATFSFDTLEDRLRELAFLNKGVRIQLKDERNGKEATFQFQGGIAEFVEFLNQGEEVEHKPIYFHRSVDAISGETPVKISVEVALQYSRSEDERVRTYANNAYNPEGGTHLTGFRSALTRTLNSYAEKNNLYKGDMRPIGADFREGLTAIVSVQLPTPQFESQTKIKLNNSEVEGAVSSAVSDFLSQYLEEHPKEAQKLIAKIVLAAEARIAAHKAKQVLKDRKNILSGGGLPGKLMDCTTRDREASELFLVEGNSAGGSADTGRDREFQAILPLRGKPLNVEKAILEKLLKNEEITSIISALGVDIGIDTDISNLRYGKIVILTDADVDGQHIRTLLLTFFFRQMRKLIEANRIFIARPPLYKVTQKKQIRYVQTIPEMQKELIERGQKDTKLMVIRADAVPAVRPATFGGEQLTKVVQVLGELEELLQIVERRGLNMMTFLSRPSLTGGLPLFHVVLAGKEYWFHTTAQVDEFRAEKQRELGRELVVADDALTSSAKTNGNAEGHAGGVAFFLQELHEVRAINRHLEKLKEFGLKADDLAPLPRLAGREPAVRFVLEHGESRKSLTSLRELVTEVRRLGERGLSVTRFKGLGEMDGEELWETTLDPEKRTLLRVTLEDAIKADQMFRVLMGEKVEPRRDFIQKHALEVKEIDYHGA